MTPRRATRQVKVGDGRTGIVLIGGGIGHGQDTRAAVSRIHRLEAGPAEIEAPAPVTVQSMASGYTHDVDKCVAEIHKLAAAGADIVRVAVPERKDTHALPAILRQTTVPIVADVHFHYKRALESIEAGVHKIRLNPGNISDRSQVEEVIRACRDAKIPIRVGVNEGSIVERKDKQKRAAELAGVFGDRRHGAMLAIMIAKLEEYLDIFYDNDFFDVVISAKSIDPTLVIDAYTEIARRFDHPLHLGVTHAGPKETGCIRSVVALGTLLANGIGDTIRISYANDPIYEVEDGLELLWSLGLRERKGAELIACPTCGRIQVDLFTLTQNVRAKLAEQITVPMKVAVMGCVVNGPGEAEGADVAVFAGDRKGIIYVQGERVATVGESEILDRLLAECVAFQNRVRSGQAKLGEKKVHITPPDPIGELGSGWEKMAATRLTVEGQ
ncbi:MAG: flavodoxin-dependent (E)-4-hydroxy-3-methylbut-2-enyl-diphosphate synthase [Leptolyngbya sp. PLA3]|nr:MAG: flavodoxin-dependent (E)-4-hydroxy-3-methylbut-2-enyl-diphosphate synthase [Cyanobacteria bacterium CYA]MCE7968259.1 flavodoxin-dependent (E)-4-hydroxy-3-methylbut-2-enyl-diphosphate synthase [Leptolyngbya sp. PL-A3]